MNCFFFYQILIISITLRNIIATYEYTSVYEDYNNKINTNRNKYSSYDNIDSIINYDDSNDENNNSDSDDDEDILPKNSINRIRLNKELKVECPIITDLTHEFNFKFDSIRFNGSIVNIETIYNLTPFKIEDELFSVIKSDAIFDSLFDDIEETWNENAKVIENSKYSDSGRYYCVYHSPNRNEYLIKSFLFIVYDGKFFFWSLIFKSDYCV